MHILHIDSEKDVSKIDKIIKQGADVFIIVYMENCGPCDATRPEWEKIDSALKEQYAKNDKLFVIDVNKDFLPSIKNIGDINGFPTMKYIGDNGKTIETYENSSVKKKDRSVTSFINWIESKINKMVSTTPTSSAKNVYNRISKTKKHRTKTHRRKTHHTKTHHTKTHHTKTHNTKTHNTKTHNTKRHHTGGKWSNKYKLSINCNKPKGFSQRQYCKYSRKK